MEKCVSIPGLGKIDFRYYSVDIFPSISPSLCFELTVVPLREQFGLSDIIANLYLTKVDGSTMHIGRMASKEPLIMVSPGDSRRLSLFLDLDHYKLHRIEKLRGGKDLALRINAEFVLEKRGQPQDRQVGSLNNFDFVIPKSDWIEKILPYLGFKDVSLIEIPKLNQEFQEVIERLNEAWRQHSMGKYDNTLTECRKALETLSGEAKKRGFETKKKETGKPIPDWKQLFGSENFGNILGTINQKMYGFLAPGAHAGKTINREDADFGLLVTHGLVTLVTEKLLKKP